MTARSRRKGARSTRRSTPSGSGTALRVTPADAQERAQVGALADAVQEATGATVDLAWVDQGYTGDEGVEEAAERGIDLAAVKLPAAKKGFVPHVAALGGGAFVRLGDAVPPVGEGR